MVDVRGRAAARHIVRLDDSDGAPGVAAVDANDHRNSQDIDLFATVARDLNRLHGKDRYTLSVGFS
jgi:hypothetical protein